MNGKWCPSALAESCISACHFNLVSICWCYLLRGYVKSAIQCVNLLRGRRRERRERSFSRSYLLQFLNGNLFTLKIIQLLWNQNQPTDGSKYIQLHPDWVFPFDLLKIKWQLAHNRFLLVSYKNGERDLKC